MTDMLRLNIQKVGQTTQVGLYIVPEERRIINRGTGAWCLQLDVIASVADRTYLTSPAGGDGEVNFTSMPDLDYTADGVHLQRPLPISTVCDCPTAY